MEILVLHEQKWQIILAYLFNSRPLAISNLLYTGVKKRVNIQEASTQPPTTGDDLMDNILQQRYATQRHKQLYP